MPKEEEVLTVSVPALKDFQVCELYYKYKYQTEEHVPQHSRDVMIQRFENTLQRVISFFFYKRQAEATPSYNALLNRWEKLWFPKDMDAYDIAIEQHESAWGNLASYTTVASRALLKFYDDFSDDLYDPIIIDESFLITLGPGLRLEGDFDLVLRWKDNYKVLLFSAHRKRVPMAHWILDFAAQKLAYEQHRNHPLPYSVQYGLYDLASSTPGMIDVAPTSADVKALLYWANQAKEENGFVPRRGLTSYCKGCIFDKPCSEWTWPA